MSRAEKGERRKDRSRSKSPFRSFRWKKSAKSSSGAVSDDEGGSIAGTVAGYGGSCPTLVPQKCLICSKKSAAVQKNARYLFSENFKQTNITSKV